MLRVLRRRFAARNELRVCDAPLARRPPERAAGVARLLLVTLSILSATGCAGPAEHPAIPLNLDFTRPGLVNPDRPWGWSTQPLEAAGVDVSLSGSGNELRLARSDDGPPSRAIYDLNSPFAGRELQFAASVRTTEPSTATARVGILSLGADWELTEAWSDETAEGPCRVSLHVGNDSTNTQLVVEYAGSGELIVSSLQLSLDGVAADSVLPGQEAPNAPEVAWVREHALPLRTTDPREPLDDLAALTPLIGDATLVLLGESTHGSSELFDLRHRIFRWLAQHHGFTVIALEDHPYAARAIDHYVQTGEGDAEELVGRLFSVWARQETLELVRWMRQATAAGEVRVSVVGFDLQVPLGSFAALTAFAKEHDPDLAREIETALGPMKGAWDEGWYPRRSEEEHAAWSAAAERILSWVEERTEEYRKRAGSEAADRAFYDARLIWQSAEVSRSWDHRLRDAFMADNLSWIKAHRPPGTRIAVWAHNTHVRLDEDAMGQHLERLHPNEVVSFGLATQEGDYTAYNAPERRMQKYALFPGPMASVEYLLHQSGLPIFALDLAPAATAPEAQPLRTPRLHRNIGLFPADLGFYRAPMTEGFDALLFVDRTTATRPLPGRSR